MKWYRVFLFFCYWLTYQSIIPFSFIYSIYKHKNHLKLYNLILFLKVIEKTWFSEWLWCEQWDGLLDCLLQVVHIPSFNCIYLFSHPPLNWCCYHETDKEFPHWQTITKVLPQTFWWSKDSICRWLQPRSPRGFQICSLVYFKL